MNKKAAFLWPIIIAVLIGLGFLFFSYNYGAGTESYIGASQLDLIKKSLDMEKKLLYNDLLLQHALRNSSKAFGQTFTSEEKYFDYPILTSSKQDVNGKIKSDITQFVSNGVENSPYREINVDYDFFLTQNAFVALSQFDFLDPIIQQGPGYTVEVTQSDIRESLTGERDPLQIQPLIDIKNIVTCSSNIISRDGCKVRESAARKLQKASEIARSKGYKIYVTSAYRSLDHQKRLFESACQRYGSCQAARRWVAAPSPTSPHVTGGALDVCLYYADGRPTESCSRLLSKNYNDEHTILLEEIMCQAGFIRYSAEWWHFEYATQRWERGVQRNECMA